MKRLDIVYIALFLLAVSLFTSCTGNKVDPEFVATSDFSLKVKDDMVFRYDPLTCQVAFNREKGEFRVHTDNMSDFFVATFVQLPSTLGQTVLADLVWTTERDVLTRKNLTLEVIRIEGDQFWLWSDTGKIGLCMRILE